MTDFVWDGGRPPHGEICGSVSTGPVVVAEGEQVAHVQRGDHLGFGTGHFGLIPLALECWNHQSLTNGTLELHQLAVITVIVR